MRIIKLFGLRIFPFDLRIDYNSYIIRQYTKKILLLNHDWYGLEERMGIKRRLLIYLWRFVIVLYLLS